MAEFVAEGKSPLVRPCLLLIPPGTAEYRVEAQASDRVEQRGGLQPVPARPPAGLLDHPAGVDGFLHRGDDQADTEFGRPAVPELKDVIEVVTGIDIHHSTLAPRLPPHPPAATHNHHPLL